MANKNFGILSIIIVTLILLFVYNGKNPDDIKKETASQVTRQLPSSTLLGSTFTVTYTAVGDNTKWAVPIEDVMVGACSLISGSKSIKLVITHEIGESTTLTKTISINANGVGDCTFTGSWTDQNTISHYLNPMITKIVSCVPSTEVCNNLDDDCDGSIDNGLTQTQSCGSNIGYCQYGTQTKMCLSGIWGSWGTCTGGRTAITEICNNEVDEDCNGLDLMGNTPADTNCDNCVATSELISLINKWVSNTETTSNLITAINAWTSGTC